MLIGMDKIQDLYEAEIKKRNNQDNLFTILNYYGNKLESYGITKDDSGQLTIDHQLLAQAITAPDPHGRKDRQFRSSWWSRRGTRQEGR